ncbi:hypothetical protein PVAG01_01004 [Phlyctema vagabunda]|uniref:Uncharacterized protein n=1 Tax=Phlyctema vagabunda TaxID=108571 RepID=A0ABR4PVW8_9HELO
MRTKPTPKPAATETPSNSSAPADMSQQAATAVPQGTCVDSGSDTPGSTPRTLSPVSSALPCASYSSANDGSLQAVLELEAQIEKNTRNLQHKIDQSSHPEWCIAFGVLQLPVLFFLPMLESSFLVYLTFAALAVEGFFVGGEYCQYQRHHKDIQVISNYNTLVWVRTATKADIKLMLERRWRLAV